MEIQALQHNENLVRYRITEKLFSPPDFTLASSHSTFRTNLRPSFIVKGTFQLICCSISPILTIITIFAQTFIAFYLTCSTQSNTLISAFGLGTAFLRLFGFNMIYSFNNNLITLISQAHGARDPFAVGIHFQRGLLFQLPLFCVSLLSIAFCKDLFHFFKIDTDAEVISTATSFIAYSSPSLLFSGIFDILRIYLCGQNSFSLPFYVKLFTLFINAILSYYLLAPYSLIGIAIATNISELLGIIILCFFTSRLNLTSWIKPTLMSFSKSLDYISFTFPGGFAIYLHFLYIEILVFFVSSLNDRVAMSAHVFFINLRPLINAIPLGTSVSVASFVGQSIGESAKKKAQTAALMGVITCNAYFVIEAIACYFLQTPLATMLYISNISELQQFTFIFNLYVFLIIFVESHQIMLTAIIKGIGMLHYNLKFYLLGFYVIGLPVTALLAHTDLLSLTAIWLTYLLSSVIVCACQLRFLLKINWDSLVDSKNEPIGIDNDIELPLIQSTQNIPN